MIEGHIRSSRHVKGKEKLASKEAREKDISDTLTKYDSHVHPVGETLQTDIRVFQVKNGYALSSSQYLTQY